MSRSRKSSKNKKRNKRRSVILRQVRKKAKPKDITKAPRERVYADDILHLFPPDKRDDVDGSDTEDPDTYVPKRRRETRTPSPSRRRLSEPVVIKKEPISPRIKRASPSRSPRRRSRLVIKKEEPMSPRIRSRSPRRRIDRDDPYETDHDADEPHPRVREGYQRHNPGGRIMPSSISTALNRIHERVGGPPRKRAGAKINTDHAASIAAMRNSLKQQQMIENQRERKCAACRIALRRGTTPAPSPCAACAKEQALDAEVRRREKKLNV